METVAGCGIRTGETVRGAGDDGAAGADRLVIRTYLHGLARSTSVIDILLSYLHERRGRPMRRPRISIR
jgi:cobyric acid synthase